MITVINPSNYYNGVEESEKNLFDQDFNTEVKETPCKHLMMMMPIKEAAQEKSANENLNFLINLATVSSNTKPTEDEPWKFNEAWNHLDAKS